MKIWGLLLATSQEWVANAVAGFGSFATEQIPQSSKVEEMHHHRASAGTVNLLARPLRISGWKFSARFVGFGLDRSSLQ